MTPHESPRHPGWRTGDIVRTVAIVILAYGAMRLFLRAHTLVFAAFLGVLFGLAVSAGATQLRRFRIPRGIGAGAIVVCVVALLAGFVAWTGPTVRQQSRELRERLPEAFAKADRWLGAHNGGLLGGLLAPAEEGADSVLSPTPSPAPSTQAVPHDSLSHLQSLRKQIFKGTSGGAGRFVVPVLSLTLAALSGMVLVLFLSIYIGADPDTYRDGILSLTPYTIRPRIAQVLDALSRALRRWLVTQLIAMITIGVITTIVLLVLNVRAAIPLGILAGLLEFVPTIGPIMSSIPAIAMAFIDSPEKAAIVAVAYFGIQFLENHILIPLLMKEGVDLPPVLTILTQGAMAIAFGFMGLFVAVPVLVTITILVKMLYVEDVIGQDASLPYTDQPVPAPR